jgi:hypothetical protein
MYDHDSVYTVTTHWHLVGVIALEVQHKSGTAVNIKQFQAPAHRVMITDSLMQLSYVVSAVRLQIKLHTDNDTPFAPHILGRYSVTYPAYLSRRKLLGTSAAAIPCKQVSDCLPGRIMSSAKEACSKVNRTERTKRPALVMKEPEVLQV